MQQQYVTLGQPIGNRQIKRFVNIREPLSALDEKHGGQRNHQEQKQYEIRGIL